jgi:hypothetical protein
MVAEFGDEEILPAGILIQGKPVFAAIGRFDLGTLDSVVGHVIALDPGAEIAIGDIVFQGAGANAATAANALGDIDQHSPPMFGSFVIGSDLRGAGANKFPGDGSGRE